MTESDDQLAGDAVQNATGLAVPPIKKKARELFGMDGKDKDDDRQRRRRRASTAQAPGPVGILGPSSGGL